LSSEAATLGAFAVAFLTVLAATPLAIRLANRLAFYDRPGGYKVHRGPTPYLGGTAVMAGIAVGTLPFAGVDRNLGAILCGACLLLAVGTVDDRRTVRPSVRLVATGGGGALLWASGSGWALSDQDLANLALTIAWVVALVNALNLMDNMDGAAATVTAVSTSGIAVLAFRGGDEQLAVIALALAGGCVAFLRYNLARPARIFLGDGGSMPLGFILAASVMALPQAGGGDAEVLVPAGLLVGVAIFDTTLVIVSRSRRRATIWLGARDHLTHRLLPRLGSAHAVALALAAAQAILSVSAIAAVEVGSWGDLGIAGGSIVVVALGVWLFETGGRPIRRARPVSPVVTKAPLAGPSTGGGLVSRH
jgi:UDP-GlcNAc:undecaprenyl-phosphate/decaprenyl-phosphate GlcNAc-1-phosphate transferase